MSVEMDARKTLKERQEYAATVPWITRRKTATQCEAFPSNSKNKRCAIPAYWKYRFSKKGFLFSAGKLERTFCWTHLQATGIWGSPFEYDRTMKWFEKHPPNWSWEQGKDAVADETD